MGDTKGLLPRFWVVELGALSQPAKIKPIIVAKTSVNINAFFVILPSLKYNATISTKTIAY